MGGRFGPATYDWAFCTHLANLSKYQILSQAAQEKTEFPKANRQLGTLHLDIYKWKHCSELHAYFRRKINSFRAKVASSWSPIFVRTFYFFLWARRPTTMGNAIKLGNTLLIIMFCRRACCCELSTFPKHPIQPAKRKKRNNCWNSYLYENLSFSSLLQWSHFTKQQRAVTVLRQNQWKVNSLGLASVSLMLPVFSLFS